MVGEIYRELDTTLRGNRVLTQQIHDAFRTGRFDVDHQKALVGIDHGAGQAGGCRRWAKRVMNEWTSTVVTVNSERARETEECGESGGYCGDGWGGHGWKAEYEFERY